MSEWAVVSRDRTAVGYVVRVRGDRRVIAIFMARALAEEFRDWWNAPGVGGRSWWLGGTP